MTSSPLASGVRMLGRYALHQEIASGGMATVYFGRLLGPVGFSRTVAIKRLHPQFAKDPEFVTMFLDEARLAARIKHPNVVSILDVVADDGELFLVMEYVRGESLSRLQQLARQARSMPLPIVAAIVIGTLCGLHAAHDACDERGESLNIVHRDVSPQNVLVGADGIARLLDFGIAKAVGRLQTTREGQFKGKLAYMAPEQVLRETVDRRTDVYAAGVVLYSLLTGGLPFEGSEAATLYLIAHTKPEPPRSREPSISPELDALVMRALSASRDDRFATAHEMAEALERIVPPATQLAVGAWVERVAQSTLEQRALQLLEVERTPSGGAETKKPLAAISTTLETGGTPQGALDASASAITAIMSSGPREPTEPSKLRWAALGLGGGLALAGLVAIGSMTQASDEGAASPPPPVSSAVEPSIAALPSIAPEVAAAPSPTSAPSATGPTSSPSSSVQASVKRPLPHTGRSPSPSVKKTEPSATSRKQPDYGF